MPHFRRRAAALLMLFPVCLSGCGLHEYVFTQFIHVIDTPTAEERAQSQAFYAQYPDKDAAFSNGQRSLVLDGGMVVQAIHVRPAMATPWQFCRNIEQHSARTSNAWAIEGLPLFGAGLALAGAGTARVIHSGPDEEKEFRQGWTTLAFGAFLTGLGAYALERSNAASKASSVATLSMANTDPDGVYNGCITAKATWVSSRETAVNAAKYEMVKHINFGPLPSDGGVTSTAVSESPPDGGRSDGGVHESGTSDGGNAE